MSTSYVCFQIDIFSRIHSKSLRDEFCMHVYTLYDNSMIYELKTLCYKQVFKTKLSRQEV